MDNEAFKRQLVEQGRTHAALVFEGDEAIGATIVRRAIEAPIRMLCSNAGVEGAVVVGQVLANKGNYGYNVATGEYEDLVKAGVVDPTKVTRTAAWGTEVVLHGEDFTEATAFAAQLGQERQLVTVHPFDDPAIVAGQGTLALEMIADAPDLDAIVIPVICVAFFAGTQFGIFVVGPFEIDYTGVREALSREAPPAIVNNLGIPNEPEKLEISGLAEFPAMFNLAALIFALSGLRKI